MARAPYRNAIRSRQMIHTALAQLLHEKPLDKITVSELVRRADINRSTFYAHYADIPDVLDQLIDQTFAGIRESLCQAGAPEQTPDRVLRQIQTLLEQDMPLYRSILTSGAAGMLQDRVAEIVLEYLAGSRSIPALEYDAALAFCTGGLIRLYQDWFAGKLPVTLDELTRQAADLILRTVHPG